MTNDYQLWFPLGKGAGEPEVQESLWSVEGRPCCLCWRTWCMSMFSAHNWLPCRLSHQLFIDFFVVTRRLKITPMSCTVLHWLWRMEAFFTFLAWVGVPQLWARESKHKGRWGRSWTLLNRAWIVGRHLCTITPGHCLSFSLLPK